MIHIATNSNENKWKKKYSCAFTIYTLCYIIIVIDCKHEFFHFNLYSVVYCVNVFISLQQKNKTVIWSQFSFGKYRDSVLTVVNIWHKILKSHRYFVLKSLFAYRFITYLCYLFFNLFIDLLENSKVEAIQQKKNNLLNFA